ncbi:MAG: diadenylate cyclase [Thermoplasmata archaeon]
MSFADSCVRIKKEHSVSIVYIASNDEEFIKDVIKNSFPTKVIVAASDKQLQDRLEKIDVNVKKIPQTYMPTISTLAHIENLIVDAVVSDIVQDNDKVLFITKGDEFEVVIVTDTKDIGITKLRKNIENRIDVHLMDIVLKLCLEIVEEGRENRNIGTLFVIGDVENVMKHSRQLIINPFHGHDESVRSVFDSNSWETLKEFAKLDGGFIADEKGTVISAGRYFTTVDLDVDLQSGLGSRHLAAASISKVTKAISVVVSSSGIIQVFMDGKPIFKMRAH